MISSIPPEITIASFSVIGILTGYVWNDQNKRIKKLEDDIDTCPFPAVKEDIACIKNDVEWVKKYLVKN